MNTKAEFVEGTLKKPSPSIIKLPKKPEEQKPGESQIKPANKEEVGETQTNMAKKHIIKKLGVIQEQPNKIASLPDISEGRASDDTVDSSKPSNSLNDIDSMILTKEQEEMLQKTLKKHGLKAEVWTSYLETKLNNYSNFTHHWHKKNENKLDIHLELAKFEKEYE